MRSFYFSILANTTQASESAIQASHAYEEIIQAINDADEASTLARQAAEEALDFVSYLYITIILLYYTMPLRIVREM